MIPIAITGPVAKVKRVRSRGRKTALRGIGAWPLFLLMVMTSVPGQQAGNDTLRVEDPWLAFDKVEHATFSFLWVLSLQYVAVNKLDFTEKEAFPVSFTATALIGLAKEVYDARKPHGRFSKRDLAADGLGLLLASAVVLSPGGK
ncbi:MAG: hypothetical protein ACE5LH_02045 [Fidelibacterota bacterium]